MKARLKAKAARSLGILEFKLNPALDTPSPPGMPEAD
jgi:hypothetical protein